MYGINLKVYRVLLVLIIRSKVHIHTNKAKSSTYGAAINRGNHRTSKTKNKIDMIASNGNLDPGKSSVDLWRFQ